MRLGCGRAWASPTDLPRSGQSTLRDASTMPLSNVASRLCDEAKPGQILISPRALMAVEDAVTSRCGHKSAVADLWAAQLDSMRYC